MHIETSADARQSRRHAAGGGLAGPAADDRGYLAAVASRLSLWWYGNRRSPALTADTASGAGLQGGTAGEDPQPNGDAIPAPSEGCHPRSQPDRRTCSSPNAPPCATHCVTPDRRSSAQRAPPRGYASSSEHALKGLASAHAPSTGARRSAAAGASTAAASAAAWIIQVKRLHGYSK